MKFTKVLGSLKKQDKLVQKAEEKLSSVFLELALKYDSDKGTGLGGDPLIFSLVYPMEHICTENINTAATDGKRYYWSPKFVIKQSKIALRIIAYHESFHALYLHPYRRGSRNPKLWNIAVDYIVNNSAMEDLKARKKDAHQLFTKEMGRYMPLKALMEVYKNPFQPLKGYEDLHPGLDIDKKHKSKKKKDIKLPSPGEDRELTPEERKELENREQSIKYYYADPDLEEDMKSPEKIYDALYALLPKCPKCGRLGVYNPPKDKKSKKDKNKDKNKGKEKSDKSEPDDSDQGEKVSGNGNEEDEQGSCGCGDEEGGCDGEGSCGCDGKGSCGCGDEEGDGCPGCGDGFDIFGLGGTLDEHMDSAESQEKLAKRISEAMEAAKKMAGSVPASLEDELGQLTAPKITWKDAIRSRLLKSRDGHGKNDWTRFKTRPMFAGLLVPKRKDFYANFACLLDTSGSMSGDDIAFGVSQLQSLDERAEGTLVCADAEIYWDNAVKLRNCKPEELSKIKIKGRGGTVFGQFTSEYKEHFGDCDFLIIITDGYLMDMESMKDPGIPVYWLITSGTTFQAPFGRVFDIKNS